MRNLSTSIYTFEKLRQENCVYVDKTEYLYKLVTGASQQVFCARPRRFGKSLTVSTLEAIFRGKRELFEGLYIGARDYDWQEYPVVHLDFARTDMRDLDKLQMSLCLQLSQIGEEYGISLQGNNPVVMFDTLLRNLAQQSNHGVVLLVDEYDKPIFEHIEDKEDAEEFRKFLSSFYQIIKGAEAQERFVFLTGVTRLAKLSIFSKLNNLFDLTMHRDFACMMGYTQAELEENFADRLDAAAAKGVEDEYGNRLDRAGIVEGLKRWYDGFCFSADGEKVYNPVSVGQFFLNQCNYSNYWFATGTPRFIVDLMKQNEMTVADVSGARLSRGEMDAFDVADIAGNGLQKSRILTLLQQTGYLTIEAFLPRPRPFYRLRFPNKEVEDSFSESLIKSYTGKREVDDWVLDVSDAAECGRTSDMIEIFKGFIADLPYDIQIKDEKYYQSLIFLICKVCGMDVQAEVSTNIGRIDAVLDAGTHLYIMEFKLNKSAGVALQQIDDKQYAQKYILPARKKGQVLHKLGINFSYAKEDRNITDWQEVIVR